MKYGILILFLTATLQLFSDTILVGGIMEESQTWTNENTYVVKKDLIVPNNVVLSINHGVTVKIDFGRGIIIEKGSLKISGMQTDSVIFIPNYVLPGQEWKWKGIVIRKAKAESYLNFVKIIDAKVGIKLENSQNVNIENSSITDCQLGIQIVNSSLSFLVNCNIENNNDGIEITSSDMGICSDNTVRNCIIKNLNHNIYASVEKESAYQNNIITNNLIGYGNNGIWVDDNAGLFVSGNIIENNIILNNGAEFGYGLYLGQDSTLVANNIFWRNNVAVFSEQNGYDNLIINNSFYQNNLALAIAAGNVSNSHLNNTFSLNSNLLLLTQQAQSGQFRNNNLMNTGEVENIVVNNTDYDFYIPDNYWGTTDTSKINKLIYDRLDDPNLGLIEYQPFLYSLDTANPVSPPYRIIKQLVNDKVLVSWCSNIEQDLMGYRVYYGGYTNYSFSQSVEIGTDTSFVLSNGIAINDSIAATAFDSTIKQNNNQLSGHESPFAFAKIYPYAGNDTVICKNINELEIENSNIPFIYQSLFWLTSGDGYFINTQSLNPTYFPGNIDVQSGGAIISFNVITTTGDTLIDKFNLLIIDDPIVFAGNDTIVIADTEIDLVEASAQNFDSIMWITSGDGSFNNNTLVNPVYSPGATDNELGIVFLEIVAYSRCGVVTDSVTIFIEPYFSVEGKLWVGQESVNPGVIIAFKENEEGARAIQIESAESDGTFKFEKLMAGNYYLYALPDTNNIDNAVPCYYADDLRWQSAYLLPVDADVYDVDIHLPTTDFVLPSGEASISGHMEKPEDSKFNSDIYCMPWFENSTYYFCNNGLSNNTVLLFNNTITKLLDYTLTDELGNFYFSELPFGEYIVDAEKAGFSSFPSSLITLSPEHKNETGVVLQISQQKIAISINSITSEEIFTKVFPNPASAEINIPYSNPNLLSSQLEIYDIFGNRVLSYIIPIEKTSFTIKLDIVNLAPGLYFGQIINSNQTSHFRFVK